MRKHKSKAKPATPKRDHDSGLQNFMKRANHDAKLLAQYLVRWCERDEENGLVRKKMNLVVTGLSVTTRLRAS